MTLQPDILRWRMLAAVCCVAALLPAASPAQGKANSPAFRSYRSPEEIPLLLHSDPTQQSWQTFVAIRKAHGGDAVAQQELALRYFTGVGVVADTSQAAFWIRKAAENDLTQARFNLALFALHGWGTPWNPFEAYRQALICAEREMPEAQYTVGIFCIENLIIQENWERGFAWIQRAADAGYGPARDVLPLFAQQMALRRADTLRILPPGIPMTPADLDSHAVTGSVEEMRRVLSTADPETRRVLGLGGRETIGDPSDSIRFTQLSAAADAGSPEALTLLGRCARNGVGMPRDPVYAAAYFLRAIRMESRRAGQILWEMAQNREFIPEVRLRAEKGEAAAQYVWAGLFALGLEVPLIQGKAYITKEQAMSLLEKASASGYIPARIELGLLHYAGKWTVHNERRAEELWREAAGLGSGEARLRLAVNRVRRGTPATGDLETLRHASANGAMLADVALGYCCETGIGVTRSVAEASTFYRSAWRRGSQDAYRALRRIHDAIRPTDAEFLLAE